MQLSAGLQVKGKVEEKLHIWDCWGDNWPTQMLLPSPSVFLHQFLQTLSNRIQSAFLPHYSVRPLGFFFSWQEAAMGFISAPR